MIQRGCAQVLVIWKLACLNTISTDMLKEAIRS